MIYPPGLSAWKSSFHNFYCTSRVDQHFLTLDEHSLILVPPPGFLVGGSSIFQLDPASKPWLFVLVILTHLAFSCTESICPPSGDKFLCPALHQSVPNTKPQVRWHNYKVNYWPFTCGALVPYTFMNIHMFKHVFCLGKSMGRTGIE